MSARTRKRKQELLTKFRFSEHSEWLLSASVHHICYIYLWDLSIRSLSRCVVSFSVVFCAIVSNKKICQRRRCWWRWRWRRRLHDDDDCTNPQHQRHRWRQSIAQLNVPQIRVWMESKNDFGFEKTERKSTKCRRKMKAPVEAQTRGIKTCKKSKKPDETTWRKDLEADPFSEVMPNGKRQGRWFLVSEILILRPSSTTLCKIFHLPRKKKHTHTHKFNDRQRQNDLSGCCAMKTTSKLNGLVNFAISFRLLIFNFFFFCIVCFREDVVVIVAFVILSSLCWGDTHPRPLAIDRGPRDWAVLRRCLVALRLCVVDCRVFYVK